MPYKLTWESRTTMWCRFFGDVDFVELNNASSDFFNDPRSDNITEALWDFSDMARFSVEEEHASEIAACDSAASRYMKPIKAAFITIDAEFAKLAEHYIDEMDKFESRWTNRLFSSLEDARNWLSA